ncbi:MAG: hypothetical protein ACLQHK_12305 [Gallionellaceae bacterium]
MAFNPVDYYHLAGWLYAQQNPYDEACARAIISKAYYGAFLEARNRAGIADKSPGVHKKVHDYYFNAGSLALANRLDDSRIKRNDADYDTALTITSMDSGNALKLARKILQELGVTLT